MLKTEMSRFPGEFISRCEETKLQC